MGNDNCPGRLKDVFNHKRRDAILKHFRSFITKEETRRMLSLCENLHDYKHAPSDDTRSAIGQYIQNRFLAPNAPEKVNMRSVDPEGCFSTKSYPPIDENESCFKQLLEEVLKELGREWLEFRKAYTSDKKFLKELNERHKFFAKTRKLDENKFHAYFWFNTAEGKGKDVIHMDKVLKLKKELESFGLKIWLDEGQHIEYEFEDRVEGIRNSGKFVVFLTKPWILRKAEFITSFQWKIASTKKGKSGIILVCLMEYKELVKELNERDNEDFAKLIGFKTDSGEYSKRIIDLSTPDMMKKNLKSLLTKLN